MHTSGIPSECGHTEVTVCDKGRGQCSSHASELDSVRSDKVGIDFQFYWADVAKPVSAASDYQKGCKRALELTTYADADMRPKKVFKSSCCVFENLTVKGQTCLSKTACIWNSKNEAGKTRGYGDISNIERAWSVGQELKFEGYTRNACPYNPHSDSKVYDYEPFGSIVLVVISAWCYITYVLPVELHEPREPEMDGIC